jgi:hypothetical protein
VAAEPRARAEGPTLLGDLECKVCKGGTSDTSIVSQAVAQGAEEEGDGEVGSEAAVQGAGESSESDDDEGNSGFRPVLRARADSSPVGMGDRDEETPTPGQSPGEGDEFARELASTMSAIASLVVKATGRSVSNGGWLYFSGAREDYRPFRARCRLFQETYHGMTPPKLLVGMFREWQNGRKPATGITGPTGVAVGPDTEYEMFLLADDLPGRTKRVTVHVVDSLEKSTAGCPPGWRASTKSSWGGTT